MRFESCILGLPPLADVSYCGTSSLIYIMPDPDEAFLFLNRLHRQKVRSKRTHTAKRMRTATIVLEDPSSSEDCVVTSPVT